MRTRPRDVTIVKLGGSHALEPYLKDWLAALATCGGRVVIVPGGGPWADKVREMQAIMGFDDSAAHHMALLAMEQFGAAIRGLAPCLVQAASLTAIDQALRRARAPVWMPVRMALAAADLPPSWDVTSDSLAAWLAGRLGAKRVMLVKHGAPYGPRPDIDELTARGIVDRSFARYLRASRAEAAFAGPADAAWAAKWICATPRPDLP
jgi:dihydroneopterin aldolase